jgi:hypothetical protein
MSDVATVSFERITGMETAPAVWHAGWLPESSPFPELMEAHDENVRLHGAWQAAGQRSREIQARVEAGEALRASSLSEGYLRGDENPQADAIDEALSAELADAKEHSRAALTALLAHINNTIGCVIEHRPEWLAAIAEMNSGVAEEIAATEAKLRELRGKVGTHGRLEHWIARTADAGSLPMQHFPYAEVPAPLTGNDADDALRLHEFALKSYGGGLPGSTLVSDKEIARARARDQVRREQPPAEDTIDVHRLGEDDLVDWLMSTGMFDGDPRPAAAVVLAAAGGDPEMAARLLKAERRANPEAARPDLINALSEITNGKAGA